MDSEIFKQAFSECLKPWFKKTQGGWLFVGESDDPCTIGLTLYRARWGPQYKYMLKVFIDGVFGTTTKPSVDLADVGHVFCGDTPRHAEVLNLESKLDDDRRLELLQGLVDTTLVPFAVTAKTYDGVLRLSDEQKVFLLPAVRAELERLWSEGRNVG